MGTIVSQDQLAQVQRVHKADRFGARGRITPKRVFEVHVATEDRVCGVKLEREDGIGVIGSVSSWNSVVRVEGDLAVANMQQDSADTELATPGSVCEGGRIYRSRRQIRIVQDRHFGPWGMQRISREVAFDVGGLVRAAFVVEDLVIGYWAAIDCRELLEEEYVDAMGLEQSKDMFAFQVQCGSIPKAAAVELCDSEPRCLVTHCE